MFIVADTIRIGRRICLVALLGGSALSMANAATFVIDGSGAGIQASATGVAQSAYNFATVQSTASSFSQTFQNNTPLGFLIIWRNPNVPFMQGISTRDVIFKDNGRTIGFLRYGVNNAAAANIYQIGGTFYDAENSGSFPVPQGTSITTIEGSEYVAPDIAFLDMTFTVRANGFAPTAVTPSVPEPSTWLMMIAGFGAAGFALRKRPAAPHLTVSGRA